jgi:hypothetical protein
VFASSDNSAVLGSKNLFVFGDTSYSKLIFPNPDIDQCTPYPINFELFKDNQGLLSLVANGGEEGKQTIDVSKMESIERLKEIEDVKFSS